MRSDANWRGDPPAEPTGPSVDSAEPQLPVGLSAAEEIRAALAQVRQAASWAEKGDGFLRIFAAAEPLLDRLAVVEQECAELREERDRLRDLVVSLAAEDDPEKIAWFRERFATAETVTMDGQR